MCPRSSTPRVTSMLRYTPSRSSRSRPASRTSWSDPTGPASLAIAIGRTLAIPVVGLTDLPQALTRPFVAQRAGQADLVCGPRREPERRRRLVVAREVGVEDRGIVGRDRAPDACGDELWQRVLLERVDGAGAEVRERTDVEDGAPAGQFRDETGILDGADPVPDPVGLQRFERAAHRICSCRLARMGHRGEPASSRE